MPEHSDSQHGDHDDDLVDMVIALRAAHRETEEYAARLAAARQRRRELAGQLRDAGRSFRWIGAVLGVTPQAVEGFLKYHQRRRGGN